MLTVAFYFVNVLVTVLIVQVKGQSNTNDPVVGLTPEEQNVADQCFKSTPFSCDPNAKYRTMDGSCNNLQKPWWGAAGTPYIRLLKAAYKDSKNSYRVSVVDGSDLPGARLVSSMLLKNKVPPLLDSTTRMFMIIGQMVSHDVNLNPQSQGSKCCSDSGDKIVSTEGQCRPIPIPDDDEFYSKFGRKCLEYHQSTSVDCPALQSGPLLLKDLTSHYLDVSFLYGFNENTTKSLRTLTDGKLRTQSGASHPYLTTQDTSGCPFAKKNCYKGGDLGVNSHLDLAVMETVLMRCHNSLVDKLVTVNPHLKDNDEILFQEVRRFLIACFQHIIYSEWLPILLGADIMKKKDLCSAPTGYSDKYNPDVNPSSLVDFSGAAFRTLHSLIPNTITLGSETIPFSNSFHKAGDILQEGNNFDADLHSLLTDHSEQFDHYNTDEIRNKFVMSGTPLVNGTIQFGDDVIAADVQRSRDYGLRSYNDYRVLFNMSKFNDYDAVATAFGKESATLLAQVFKHPSDIDFYVGSEYELTNQNISAPSTLQAVWAEAFARYKIGDRFFYERGNQPWSFTLDQLNVIKSIKLAHLVCLGFDTKTDIQRDVFYPANPSSNPMISCDTLLQQLDLTSFKVTASPSASTLSGPGSTTTPATTSS
uniref:Chorion peroxidase n=1 Tax=Cacopsylla melanoneura TaxID=428564 RepID=A0A8D9BYI8_9HEMI